MEPDFVELRDFLNEKALQYNHPDFIELDPIQIPHLYRDKEDIEIAGFLTATIAWGNRVSIIKSAHKMMDLMGNSPYDFILNHREKHLEKFDGFVHRTFSSTDFLYFIYALKYLYQKKEGLEGVFAKHQSATSLQGAIHHLKKEFFSLPHPARTLKHLPDPLKGSAAKRINMFLRWMVRNDHAGVDFGLWKSISPSILSCPLDVHTGTIARKLGLLKRKQNDARAVHELDLVLRSFDPEDPVRYDFALFGLGASEKF
ncbi:MAG: TIGR02757 family protein [Bacteroidales bacterium]|nr:TIGR02757 family protein [Bacteroidales bacterium]